MVERGCRDRRAGPAPGAMRPGMDALHHAVAGGRGVVWLFLAGGDALSSSPSSARAGDSAMPWWSLIVGVDEPRRLHFEGAGRGADSLELAVSEY